MDFKLIVTVGPSILFREKLREVDSLGECIYRINGAHADADAFGHIVDVIRASLPDADIMIDLPGNKLRTANLAEPMRLIKGETVELFAYQLNCPEALTYIKPGDMILANDSTVKLKTVEVDDVSFRLVSHSDGIIHNNKSLHIKNISASLPFLFKRDMDLIKKTLDTDVQYLSLSYVRNAGDVVAAKKALTDNGDPSLKLIAKIETEPAVENLDEILSEVEFVNIDRGDLSAEIGIMNLPFVLEKVLSRAMDNGTRLFLATQFLKNMENMPIPLISEIMDLKQTLKYGVAGIQLSEETATGKYAVECAKLVFDLKDKCG